ncbi:MAG: GGDEF domain-containing protein [Oleiphilaceae bacterium]|nr:GGDEF domain-containing protein [Oleiphilaceae bacterium]
MVADKSLEQQLADLKKENKALRAKDRLLHAILDNAPLLISAKDKNGNVMFTNPHFALLDGPAPAEYINRNVYDLFPKDIADQLWQNDLRAQASDVPIQAEEEVMHCDGEVHTYHTTKFRLLDESGDLLGTCAISVDVTDNKQLEYDAYHDFLTGLCNHRYFAENLERDLGRAKRNGTCLVVALIDLDNFKMVNDSYGHDQGNKVLQAVATTMQTHFNRPDDVSIRVGGDEFALVFGAKDEQTALHMLQTLREELNRVILELVGELDPSVTCSIGVRIVSPDDRVSFNTLYTEIDDALYHVKRGGKNAIYGI